MTVAPRVTYAVLAHSREQQLLRLVRVLRHESPNSSVVIHWDSNSPTLDPAPFAELGRVFMVEDAVHPEWGGFQVVEATLRSMRAALARTRFDWLVVLSGQDYPVAPLARIERELTTSACDAFIDTGRVASGRVAWRWRRDGATRLGRRYYFAYRPVRGLPAGLPRRARGALHRAAFLVDEHQPFVSLWPMPSGTLWRLGVRRWRTPFGLDRPCRVGSNWFSLSHAAVERVVEQAGADSTFARHYRRTIIADESYFQTFICADPGLVVRCDNSRYQVWEDVESPVHPDTLTVDSLDAILSSGKHFARKFDERVDVDVLDRLDEHRREQSLPTTPALGTRAI